jgi:acetyl esterase
MTTPPPVWPDFDPELAAWQAESPMAPAGSSVDVMREFSVRNNATARSRVQPSLLAAATRDDRLDGPRGPIDVRIFTPPHTTGPVPLIVYFHGGGWVLGGIDTQLAHAYRQCIEVGAVVVSVGYRCAPEDTYPAAFDDCLAAATWAADRAAALGASPELIVVSGDSAGAQLAASVALARRDAGRPLAAQLLLYPVTDAAGRYRDPQVNARYPSRSAHTDGPGLTMAAMAWFADTYLAAEAADDDWRVSPLHADLSGLAPAVVHTAGHDLLRDEGRAYAHALRSADVEVTEREYASLNHGYFGLGGVSPAADRAASEAAADLRAIVGLPPRPIGATAR